MAPLAEVFVRVRALTGDVRRDVERQFDRAGREAGEQFGESFQRDANGRLHDSLGRFVGESRRAGDEAGSEAGRGFGDGFGNWMVTLGAAAAALAAPVAVAGTAFAAFAAIAAPSVIKVIAAQEDLLANWATLDSQQRASALVVRALTDDFQDLAKSYQPQALGAFNSVVGTARGLLPQLTAVLDSSAFGVQGLISKFNAFVEGEQVSSFLAFAGREAPQALDLLGDTAITAGDTALQLLQDLAPLGISMLQLANGTLSAVNAIASINPLLAQMAVTTLLLRGPITGLVGGIGLMAGRMRAAAAPAAGLTRSARLLNIATAAGPTLYIAAGTALAFLAFKALTAKSSTEKLIDALRASYQATGNNIAGYKQLGETVLDKLHQSLGTTEVTVKKVSFAGRDLNAVIDNSTGKMLLLSNSQQQLVDAYLKNKTQVDALGGATVQLSQRYTISQEAARRLATAAGVDLSKSLTKSGGLTAEAALKLDRYKVAADQANNPTFRLSESMKILADRTSSVEQKTKALTEAYNAELGPAFALFDANMQLRQGYSTLASQLGSNRARMTGNSEASRNLQQALRGQIDTVWKLYSATVIQTGSQQKGSAAVRAQIPLLYALAGNNKTLRGQVDALAAATGNNTGKQNVGRAAFIKVAESMLNSRSAAERLWREYSKLPDKTKKAADGVQHFSERTIRALKEIKSKDLDVTVNAQGTFKRATTAGLAAGGPVPSHLALGPGGPTSDDVPIWGSVGEFMLSATDVRNMGGFAGVEQLRAMAERGEMQRLAAGGAVTFSAHLPSAGHTAQVVGGYGNMHFNLDKTSASAREEALSLAAAWKKYADEGGNALAWARSQAGKPYLWGGTGPAGYDCSGFMSAIVNVIRGRSPYNRLFTTMDFGAAGGPGGFLRNYDSIFRVGVTDAGVGHMAGTLGGVAVESSGSGRGVRVGGGARSADDGMFTRRYGLTMAHGGPVISDLAARALRPSAAAWEVGLAAGLGLIGDPSSPIRPVAVGPFDTGGLMPAGQWPNRSRRPEPVLTDQQWGDIHTLARRGSRTIEVHVHGVPGIPTDQQIAGAVDRTLAMHGDW